MRNKNFLITLFFYTFNHLCIINHNTRINGLGIVCFSIKDRTFNDLNRGLIIMKTLIYLINNKIISKEEFIFLNEIIKQFNMVTEDFIKLFEQLKIE